MGFAVAARFATRNPAHEVAARDLIRRVTGRPVTCSHELSAQLNGPKRALTAVLNARLIGMIDRLVAACERHLAAIGIDRAADGGARRRGADLGRDGARTPDRDDPVRPRRQHRRRALADRGASDALVSDIGGTTTDVALLRDGLPEIDPQGARVGGFRTMVEAVAMRTTGLGRRQRGASGDRRLAGRLRLGPRRLMPVSLLAVTMARWCMRCAGPLAAADAVGEQDGRFVSRWAGRRRADRARSGGAGPAHRAHAAGAR
jgi:N-methylhydantoinase A/oxoprolinase/acetone carboxylase beta subunit